VLHTLNREQENNRRVRLADHAVCGVLDLLLISIENELILR